MAKPKVYWLKPTIMVSWLVLGVSVALGHHFFYSWLHNRQVQSQVEQEWFRRIGTGLAFLANALLIAASSVAYTQLLWWRVRSKTISIGGVDALFGLMTNAWNLASFELWKTAPFTAMVAAILCVLPLSVVVTPSTLVVVSSPIPKTTVVEMAIPFVDHSPQRLAQWEMARTDDGALLPSRYLKPSTSIARLVSNVASSGTILPIQAPSPNSSYSLSFSGPSISCVPAETSLEERVNAVLDRDSFLYVYVGFVPDPPRHANSSGDKYADVINGLNQTLKSASTVAKLVTFDQSPPEGHARLFIATHDPGKKGVGGAPRKLTECGLYNTSYTVSFDFTNNQQSVRMTNQTQLNGISYRTYLFFNATVQATPGFFGGITGCALMDALAKMLVGYLRSASSSDGWVNDGEIQITSTILMQAHELRRLYQSVGHPDVTPTTEPLSVRNMTLAEAIDELSRNMTLSLFSNSYFLQDPSAASLQPITIYNPQNAYAYAPRNLAIAYGLAVAISVCIIVAGLACIHASEGTFTTSFSTVLRMTRGSPLDGIVRASDTSGKEPLPEHLTRTRISLSRGEDGDRFWFVVDAGTVEIELLEKKQNSESDYASQKRLLGEASEESLLVGRTVA